MVRSSIFIVGRVIEVHTFIISDKPDVIVQRTTHVGLLNFQTDAERRYQTLE
jgi:hypothetical protein